MPADEVDLSVTAMRTIIAGHHHVPKSSQIKVGIFLATSAGALMLGAACGSKNLWGKSI